jgi:uncharacterized phage-associated protein
MAPVSAHDIKRELRRRVPGLRETKLQKLLYYVQGWHLAVTGEPAFSERIEAWGLGPVVEKVWRDHRYDRPMPEPQEVDAGVSATIAFVVERYALFTAEELVERTHQEGPWKWATERDVDDSWSVENPEIGLEYLHRWFSQQPELEQAMRRRPPQTVRGGWQFKVEESEGFSDSLERARRGERVVEPRVR